MTRRGRMRLIGMLVLAAASAAGLIVLAFFEPRQAAAGWLIGFLFWSQIPVGCLVLSMIHRLTGGRWGWALRPVLASGTAAVPWLLIAIIPVFIAVPMLYPWTHPGPSVKPDVAADYLNIPFFIGRSLIALGLWSVLSLLIPRIDGPRAPLAAGLGMLVFGVTVSVVAIDWFLSLEPPFVSSSFGAGVAVMQLIAAMAWAVLLAPLPRNDRVIADIGGLLLAFLLGITYLDFMAFLVIWYGDLPHVEFWFVERDRFPWSVMAGAWFVLGAAAPIFALLLSRVRRSRTALRAAALSVMAGSMLYTAYLIAPAFGVGALLPAILAIVAIGLVQTAIMAGASLMIIRTGTAAHVS